MKIVDVRKPLTALMNTKALRVLTLVSLASVLTMKAFADGQVCDGNNYVPQMGYCDNGGSYYDICSCGSWDAINGYSNCHVVSGCY